MNTGPELNKATATAATGQTKAAVAPRVKLSSHGFSIDDPDPELGEQLMTDALGGRRPRCDARYTEPIGEGQRERAEA